ncbi:unnamed protein product [Arctia plantaginis]|uniref:Uncharacterized protein n=1 Tax=Arctia plantaginis TaxID=874455 RepID=A0A8S1AL54_ARCPL|nr:unnamed protein product [Arctia plantaginis]
MLRENSRHTATSKGCNSVSTLSQPLLVATKCCIYNVCVCDFTAHVLTLLATKNHGFYNTKEMKLAP